MSFLSRHAHLHGRTLWSFCRDLGLQFAEIVKSVPTALAQLAQVTDVDPQALDREALRPIGTKRWAFKGEIITSSALSRTIKRVCPLCIADDVARAGDSRFAAHHAYGRSAWHLEPLRSCPRHGVELIVVADSATGPSEVHDFASAVVPLVGDLDALRAKAKPVEASPLECYLLRRLGETEGTPMPFLDGLAWHAVADTCQMIGTIQIFGRDAPTDALEPHDRRRAGIAGFAIAAAGEDGIQAFLSELDRSYDGSRFSTDGPQARYGSMFKRLAATTDEPDLDPIREILRAHIIKSTPVGAEDRIFGKPVGRRMVHSIRSASLAYDIHPKRLRKILVADGVISDSDDAAADERVVFDAGAHEELLKAAAQSLSLSQCESYLNAGRVQARLLMEHGFITPFVELGSRRGGEKNFSKAKLDDFLKRLSTQATPVDATPSGAFNIPNAAKRANCSAAEIVNLILQAKLDLTGQLKGTAGYLSILVDLDEVKGHVQGAPRTGLTARDVEKELKTTTATVAALIAQGKLPTSVIVNPVNRCPTKIVMQADVDAFKAYYVSLNVLADERRMHFRRVQKDLKEAGIQPALPRELYHATFYRRSEVDTG